MRGKMVKAVVGANWGDEGKGKITDMLAQEADIIVRFQGGANAGHTIINNYGKGKVFWIPSPLGLGAKISKEYEPLLSIFEQEFDNTGAFRFKKFHEGVLMKNIETSQGVISVLINKNKEKQTIELIGFHNYKPHRMLFQDKGGEIVSQNKVYIYPEETIVIDWRKK